MYLVLSHIAATGGDKLLGVAARAALLVHPLGLPAPASIEWGTES